jgi:hypothetical protein
MQREVADTGIDHHAYGDRCERLERVTLRSYTPGRPSKHPRIAVTADAELRHAMQRVRVATGTKEADATLVRRLAVEGAEAEIAAGRERRAAAEALFTLMDEGRFDLDPESIDQLNDAKAL